MSTRRIRVTQRRPVLFGLSTIVTIVLALLAGGARFAVPVRHAFAAAAQSDGASDRVAIASAAELSERDAMARSQPAHVAAVALMRLAPETVGGGKSPRDAAVTSAKRIAAASALRDPGARVDARSRGVSAPGLPAPSSRAPPVS